DFVGCGCAGLASVDVSIRGVRGKPDTGLCGLGDHGSTALLRDHGSVDRRVAYFVTGGHFPNDIRTAGPASLCVVALRTVLRRSLVRHPLVVPPSRDLPQGLSAVKPASIVDASHHTATEQLRRVPSRGEFE